MSILLSTITNEVNPLQLSKAWVNFNGLLAGTNAPRASYNVSSVTRTGVGLYTVNFATPLADANYSVSVQNNSIQGVSYTTMSTLTASSVRVGGRYYNGTVSLPEDTSIVCVTVFGN